MSSVIPSFSDAAAKLFLPSIGRAVKTSANRKLQWKQMSRPMRRSFAELAGVALYANALSGLKHAGVFLSKLAAGDVKS
jgi:hypothetical protein